MKIDPDLKRKENFTENKTFCSKCLAKEIKLSSFSRGNSRKILFFIANLTLLILVCLKFSFNFV